MASIKVIFGVGFEFEKLFFFWLKLFIVDNPAIEKMIRKTKTLKCIYEVKVKFLFTIPLLIELISHTIRLDNRLLT